MFAILQFMQLLYRILIIGIGLLVYFYKPKWVVIFWLLTTPIILPLFCLLSGVLSMNDVNGLYMSTHGHFSILFLILIIFEAIKNKIPKLHSVYISLGALSLYFLFHNVITHFDTSVIVSNILEATFTVFPLLYLIINKENIPSLRIFIGASVFLCFFEFVFCLLNFVDIYAYMAMYFDTSYDKYGVNEGLLKGSFDSANSLSDFISTLYLFISIEFFSKNSINMRLYLSISFIVFFIVLAAGIRTNLVLILVILVCNFHFYGKSHRKLKMNTIILAIALIIFLFSINPVDFTENQGIIRMVDGFTSFFESKRGDGSTTGMSTYLIDHYFWNSPIIGNGFSWKGDGAYGTWGFINEISNFKSDARLAYMLVEYGIIGVLLYLLYYVCIVKYLVRNNYRKNKKIIYIIFTYFLLLTITEAGIFDKVLFPMVFIYLSALILDEKKNIQRSRVN